METFQEYQILELGTASEQAYKEIKNLIQHGAWVLKLENNTEITRSPNLIILRGIKKTILQKKLIYELHRKITPEELTSEMIVMR